uniref:Uncharacterized protein n=1 Tax=Phlebotomus papatasi TaxID=29031 RepID=A0A1B0DF66_PHLPP
MSVLLDVKGSTTVATSRQEQDLLLLDALTRKHPPNYNPYESNAIMDMLGRMIPQTCKYKGKKFDCGLSISCVLGGGKPMDLCSGGMIWSCCIDEDLHPATNPDHGAIHNAMDFFFASAGLSPIR